MKKQITLKDVAACAVNWNQAELEGLKELADSLLRASSAEQRAIPALHALFQGSKGGGYFEDKIINGKSYRYLRYRTGKKLRSVYLGRSECFVNPRSKTHEAAKGFRESSRTLCRLMGILQSRNPITPLDVAIQLADPDDFSPQIERVLEDKPPKREKPKLDLRSWRSQLYRKNFPWVGH